MNQKRQFILYLLLALAGVLGTVFCVAMLVMAVIFSEWGRVIFYGTLAIFSIELACIMIYKLVRLTKSDRE